MNQKSNAVINTVPAANALRRVEGFNPLKYLRTIRSERTNSEVLKLELPYQKLWFRLAFPNGRMLLNNLRITDQLAIFEAIVFSDKGDDKPLSRITASATPGDSPNGQYIQAAQDKALSEALENAGFGIQLCDIAESAGRSDYGSFAQAAPQETDSDLPFTMRENTAPAEPPAAPVAPVAQSEVRAAPVTAPEAEPVAQAAPVAAAPVEVSAAQTAPAAAAEPEPVEMPASTPAAAEAAVATEKPNDGAEAMAEPSAARLPSSLELLRASTQFQPADAPAAESNAEEAPAAEQSASDDGEPPMNTASSAVSYSPEMTVDEIIAAMTPEEAQAVVVNEGICKGWTLGQVASTRGNFLRYYVHSNRSDNVLKAAAQIMLDSIALPKAS